MSDGKVFIVWDEENRVLGVYKSEEEAQVATNAGKYFYEEYSVNDDYDEVVYLTVPVTQSEYSDIMLYCEEEGVSPTVLFRSILLDELAK